LALEKWRERGNRHGEALTLTAIGHLQSKLGDKQQALEQYNRASLLLQSMRDKAAQAFVCNGRGYVYEELNDTEKSLENYTEALKLFQEIRYREGEAGSLYKIGKANFTLGNYEVALEYFQRSQTISRELKDVRMQAVAVGLIGQALAALHKDEQALTQFNQALHLNRAGFDKREEAHTLRQLGDVLHRLGKHEAAQKYFSQALELSRLTADRFGEFSTRRSIAVTYRNLGKLDEAYAELKGALAITESLRTNVASADLRMSYATGLREAYDLQIDILMRLYRRSGNTEFLSLAFETSERARARALVDSLVEAQAGISRVADPALLDQAKQIEDQLDRKAEEQAQMLSSGKTEAATDIATQISDLTNRFDDIRTAIKASDPRYVNLTQPRPPSIKEVQERLLDDKSILLEYALGDEDSDYEKHGQHLRPTFADQH
jgi:tetratricopeptide (TPR) repeat protein